MTTLLHIDASARRRSISREVSDEFARAWRAEHPDGDYLYRDVAMNPVPFIDEAWTELCDAVLAHGSTDLDLMPDWCEHPRRRRPGTLSRHFSPSCVPLTSC